MKPIILYPLIITEAEFFIVINAKIIDAVQNTSVPPSTTDLDFNKYLPYIPSENPANIITRANPAASCGFLTVRGIAKMTKQAITIKASIKNRSQ